MAKKQLLKLTPGDTFKHNGDTFEVLHVSGQGEEGAMHHFVYEICLHSEAEERRRHEAELAEEQRSQADQAAQAAQQESPAG